MLLALHGFTENDETWRPVLAPVAKDVRCALLPGHGDMPCPAGLTIEALADQLAARHLGAPADVLGYSMGGRIALVLALRHPALVRRLILVSSGPGFRDDKLQGTRRTNEMALADTLEDDGLGPFVAMWEQNPLLKPAKPLPRALEEDIRARRLNHDPLGLAGALRQLGAGAMPNLWDRLHGIRQPTLLIAGSADTRYCEVMGEMATLIAGATCQVVADAGHGIHRERPDEVRRLVKDFLG
ncbi:MAG: alpha/beta fold hydrolase [Planctomycetes bacterium]|nr:alpha/beta fold hydrolase [Planctomycetota bacterium]